MTERPTIYLSNWASHRSAGHHGPGKKYTIMAQPRHWEHGDGRVSDLVPAPSWLREYKEGFLTSKAYQARCEEQFESMPLYPGSLVAYRDGADEVAVESGDTLLCACSRETAALGECHRVWAAAALSKAGWRVILDGEEYHDER